MIPQCRTRMLWNGFVPSMVRSSTSWMSEDDGAWHLIQSRTHNAANELLTLGGSGAQVAHDRAGNMTLLPSPLAGEGQGEGDSRLACVYDAWNRLVKVSDAATSAVIATYGYDGRNFRIMATTAEGARHFYYTTNWQCIEERLIEPVATSSVPITPVVQTVWGLRYIDDLVLREGFLVAMLDPTGAAGVGDSSSTDSGLWSSSDMESGLEAPWFSDRVYYIQDPNWNVTAVAASLSGAIIERISYTAYGEPTFHDGSWTVLSSSPCGTTDLYTGRRRDPETGLYHYRYRQYDSGLGRFLSRDPIGYGSGDPNLHRYVWSRPLSRLDPLGEDIAGDWPTTQTSPPACPYTDPYNLSSSLGMDVPYDDQFGSLQADLSKIAKCPEAQDEVSSPLKKCVNKN